MKKFIGCLGVLFAALSSAALADAGKFQFVHGDVTLTRTNGSRVVPVKGDRLEEGDVITTGAQAQTQLVLNDGGLIAMRPDSRMRIDQFRFNGQADGSEQSVFGLLKGGFRAITGLIGRVNKDNYKIRTATATIGIRGTDHEALYIAPPAPGETPIGPPGTYDKVNVGQTYLQTPAGRLELSGNQVGFVPAVGNAPPQRLPTIPDFLRATPDIQTATKGTGPKAAAAGSEKDKAGATKGSDAKDGATDATAAGPTDGPTPSGPNTKVGGDGASTTATTAAAAPSTPIIAPTPNGVFNPLNAVGAPTGTALAGGAMSSSGPSNGAGTIGMGSNPLALVVDSVGDTLIVKADKFSYNRNGAPAIMTDSTTVGSETVRWGLYDGGTLIDNGVTAGNVRFFWMTSTSTSTAASLLTITSANNLTFSTVGGFTKPINEAGSAGGTITSTSITIGNISAVPTLMSYNLGVTDALGRNWNGSLSASQSLASFQTGGVNNLSVCMGACSVPNGTGNAQGVAIGNPTPVGMISSYKMTSGTASVVGAVLSK